MSFKNFLKLTFFISLIEFEFLSISFGSECDRANINKPCIIINNFVSNISKLNSSNINKIVLTKKDIDNSGAVDFAGVLEGVPELNVVRSGYLGQQSSVFLRGSNSNHTLVMINGIPINDQSTTQGLHDFGVDFIQAVERIEIFPGSGASQFGSNAIGGAINIILSSDYKDKFEYNFDKNNNYSVLASSTFIKDEHIMNFKLASVKNKSISAMKSPFEDKDKIKNYTGNFNYETWINNIKIFNTTYLRQTLFEYDNSRDNQIGYEGDNIMMTTQFGLNQKFKNREKQFIFYYNGYDREYDETGTIDDYVSDTLGVKLDLSESVSKNISFGYGVDYRNDSGEFNNRGTYMASTKGNSQNLAIYGNLGIRFNNNNFSLFLRSDNHKHSGKNYSYSTDFNKNYKLSDKKNFKIGISHRTGLRNPTLYELFGTDNYGYSGNKNLKAEKSFTNEIYSDYLINSNSLIKFSTFRTDIRDNIIYRSNKYINDNSNSELTQKGINLNYIFNNDNYSLKLFSSFLKSMDQNNQKQLRRPEKNYGMNLSSNFDFWFLGLINYNLSYKYSGKYFDTHSSSFNKIEMGSTDIINLRMQKKISNTIFKIEVNNLLDKKYERPHGYNQPGKLLNFGFKTVR